MIIDVNKAREGAEEATKLLKFIEIQRELSFE